MSLKKEIAKANIIFTFGRLIAITLSFFFSIILARLLQPYYFGLYSFCLMVLSIFIIFTDFGLNTILTRFVSNYIEKNDHKSASSVARLIFRYKFLLTIAVGILTFIFSDQIATFVFNKPEGGFVISYASIILILASFIEFFRSLLFGLKDFKWNSISQILENVIKFFVVIGFVIFGLFITGVFIGIIISYVLLNIILIIVFYKKYSFIFYDKAEIDKDVLLGFGIWTFVGSIFGTFYGAIDQFLVSILLPVENIGFYKIAYGLIWSIIYLVPITYYVLYPYFSSSEDKKRLNLLLFNSIRYSAIFIFPFSFLLSAFSKPLVAFLYKESYMPVVQPLTILSFLSIFIVLSGIIQTFFYGIKRPDIPTKIVGFVLGLNIIFNYIFIVNYGLIGAAVAILIVKFIETFILFFISVSKEKMTFSFSIILKPLIASLVMYIFALFFLPNITNYFTLVLYGALSLIVYLIVMFLIRGIETKELFYFKKYVKYRF